MPLHVTLPDGSPLELPDGATALDAAQAIGPRLAQGRRRRGRRSTASPST